LVYVTSNGLAESDTSKTETDAKLKDGKKNKKEITGRDRRGRGQNNDEE
jgi:hypothetical protein